MTADFRNLMTQWLHDPPDKALGIKNHEARAATYLTAALGYRVTKDELHSTTRAGDQHAAIAERFPMPTAGSKEEGFDQRCVSYRPGENIEIRHPLSGLKIPAKAPALSEGDLSRAIEQIAGGDDRDARARFMALWRLLPDELARRDPGFARIPADTRIPDHSIWNHLDISAGLAVALKESNRGGALLAFALGPVQPFIEASRSVRDLWTSSAILSWLAFRAMRPVLEEFGPTAIVFPALRRVPLIDRWLQKKYGVDIGQGHTPEQMRVPSLPHRFLAIVPEDPAIAHACVRGARDAWVELAEDVRNLLHPKYITGDAGDESWARRWDDQIKSFFDFRAVLLPRRGTTEEVMRGLLGDEPLAAHKALKGLAEAIPAEHRPGYEQDQAGLWQVEVEMAGRLIEASRAIRQVPSLPAPAPGRHPLKCTLFGTYEQMGPDDLDASAKFWKHAATHSVEGVHIRPAERFCSVALVKRFAAPARLAKEYGFENMRDLRARDTSSIAAVEWLENAKIEPDEIRERHGDWNGQWLHWTKAALEGEEGGERCPPEVWDLIQGKKKDQGPPPAYYAVLQMDGDRMGHWLRGEKTPRIGQILHHKLKKYFESLPRTNEVQAALETRRPVSPAFHAALSEALTNFAVQAAPRIVEQHKGALIYSGGDDVLALLPAARAVACARELYGAFRGEQGFNGNGDDGFFAANGVQFLVMGKAATASCGIAIVHYKEDLREALAAARAAEKAAKSAGRNLLQISACRRSGEHSSAPLPWELAKAFDAWVSAFKPTTEDGSGASDRWAYHLRAEMETLKGLCDEAMKSELRRQVERSESVTKEAFKDISGDFDKYRAFRQAQSEKTKDGKLDSGACFADFVTLCQSASFLARGRDE